MPQEKSAGSELLSMMGLVAAVVAIVILFFFFHDVSNVVGNII